MNQTKESSETIKKMTDTIIMNSRKASETDRMADRAISTASQSGRFVNESVAAMNQIAETVKNTADRVNSLGRSSEKISEIAQVINDIANQTNLLALNASIEAAHHGEEGRGFAIVADEVGKLSERTTAATREITEMVKNVLSDIKGAMTSMNSVTGEVDNSIRLFHQMNRSMNEIVDLSNSLRGMISGIAAAGKEQSDAASLINENITSINDISLEFAVLIERIAQSIDNMLNLTINLEKMVNRFKLN
jgi:methyl-accepting chemotaxis protein